MLEEFETALHRCTICHDQCQFVTAEVFATGKQTYATSRKAMLIQAVRRGDLDWSPELVEVMYSGLSSGIQHEVCVNYGDPQGWSDETLYLRLARAEIVQAGAAPGWAKRFQENQLRSGNPYGLTEAPQKQKGQTVFYADAVSRLLDPESREAWLEIASRLGESWGLLALGSSGFELYDLGFQAEAQQSAGRLYQELLALQPERILSDSPEALYMLTQVWPDWGYPLPVPIQHTSERLAELLTVQGVQLAPRGQDLVYLDPSCLSRYLGITEAPRQALLRLGVLLVELVRSRKQAPPSGSYYGKEVGEWVLQVAEDCRRAAVRVGAGGIITASPFDQRNLELLPPAGFLTIPLWRLVLDRLAA